MIELLLALATLPLTLPALSLLTLLIPAAIGGLSILYPPLHWVFAAIDFAFAMLFVASVVGLAVWSHLVDVEADGRPIARRG